MINLTYTARRLAFAMIVVTLSACLLSCEMPPSGKTNPSFAIGRGPSQPTGEAGTPPNADTPVGALIHRVDMPLDESLDACWAQVDERSVPILMHGMWMVNGLRVGILHADHAQAFADALPRINGESRGKLFSSFYPTSIRSTPRLIDPVMIDLTVPPRSPTMYKAIDGRLQLLARIGRADNGQPFLELTPHHYKPRPDLIPRSPLEKQLDGEVFQTLSVMLPIDPDSAIVVGLYRLWPEPEETTEKPADADNHTDDATQTDPSATTLPDDSDTTKPDPDQPSTTSDQPSTPPAPPSPPSIPDTLGKSLITGLRAGQPTQILMVISVIEDETPGQNDSKK